MALALRANHRLQQRMLMSFEHPSVGSFTGGSAATGSIQCTVKANYADTDFMTIPDGFNPSTVYEFDTAGDGVTPGRVQVDISGATTAADVAAILKTAIEANQSLLTVVDAGGGLLNLTHKQVGTAGNKTITENVADAGHTVSGMSGGTEPTFTGDTTQDTTVKLWKPNRKFRLDRAQYINPTGLTNDASNYFNLKVKKGSTVMANWSTQTGQQGALTADTFVAMTLSSTDANLVAAVGDEISFEMDETGSQSLPPGRLILEGRYV